VIAKISKGASGRGLVRYLFGPGKANEHSDQRVIASGVSLWAEEGRMLSEREIADLGASLDAANDTYGRNPAGGHIWHVSLSLAATERPVTGAEWAEMAQTLVRAMGFEREGVVPAAWVAIGHGLSAHGNPHIHLAASIVRDDGSAVKIWQDRKTLSRVCAEIEHAYGLSVVEGREGKGMPGLSRAERERAAKEHWAEPPRITLARRVRESRSPPGMKPSSYGASADAVYSRAHDLRPEGRRSWSATRLPSRRWTAVRRSGSGAGSWPGI
jgi:hypothetical protein